MATPDNRFMLVWQKAHLESTGWVNDIYYMVRNTDGTLVKPVTRLTFDTPGDSAYYAPNLAALSSSRAIITWVSRSSGNDDIYYAVVNSSGGLTKAVTNLSIDETVIDWWNSNVTEMSDGRILAAWEAWGCFPSEWTARIRFAVLDAAYNTTVSPTCLNNEPVAELRDRNISVTADNAGNAIFTWINDQSDTLYYALVNSNGSLRTPPMPFYTARASQTETGYVYVNSQGYGNTSFKQYQALACRTFLPATLNNVVTYFAGPWEVEPNNTFAQANGPIQSGQTYFGIMSGPSDVNDYFSFRLSAPHTAEIWLTKIAAGHNYNLTLRDANLAVVKHSGNLNNQDEHILTGILPAGQYYLQISNSGGTSGTQAYNLRAVYK